MTLRDNERIAEIARMTTENSLLLKTTISKLMQILDKMIKKMDKDQA